MQSKSAQIRTVSTYLYTIDEHVTWRSSRDVVSLTCCMLFWSAHHNWFLDRSRETRVRPVWCTMSCVLYGKGAHPSTIISEIETLPTTTHICSSRFCYTASQFLSEPFPKFNVISVQINPSFPNGMLDFSSYFVFICFISFWEFLFSLFCQNLTSSQ